jgi:hypothetical protein
VTGAITGTLTGTVVCTICGPITDSDAHGMSFTTEAHHAGRFTHWRLRLGRTHYAIPWQLVQPYPPCPHCTAGELHVEDPHIGAMVVH